jgi:DNA repair protein RadC
MMTAATDERPYGLSDRSLIFGESNEDCVPGYVLKVSDMPDEDRPREKLLAQGPQGMSVAELVAVLWGVGTRKEDVLVMARRALREYGEKTVSHELNPRQLAEAADIPLVKACQIVASFELGRRFFAKRGGRPVQVRTLKQAQMYLQEMGGYAKEQLRGLYLDSRYQVIHDEVISVGSLTANIVHPREVFRPAIDRSAVAVIIAHNHPSGVAEPTRADIQATKQLKAAGEVLGITLLDYLIVTNTKCISIINND